MLTVCSDLFCNPKTKDNFYNYHDYNNDLTIFSNFIGRLKYFISVSNRRGYGEEIQEMTIYTFITQEFRTRRLSLHF